jgi:hypothetical protein
MAIHLGRPLPDASRDRPGRRRGNPPAGANRRAVPIWSCSRWGLPCRSRCRSRGALLPHPFTLADAARRRFAFCGTFPGVAPAGRYPAPYFRGARTFLPRHSQSRAKAAIQPPSLLDGSSYSGGVKSAPPRPHEWRIGYASERHPCTILPKSRPETIAQIYNCSQSRQSLASRRAVPKSMRPVTRSGRKCR